VISFTTCTTFKAIKTRRISWAISKIKTAYRILVRKPDGRDYLGELDIDGRILYIIHFR
jgi:hypothetical protein